MSGVFIITFENISHLFLGLIIVSSKQIIDSSHYHTILNAFSSVPCYCKTWRKLGMLARYLFVNLRTFNLLKEVLRNLTKVFFPDENLHIKY